MENIESLPKISHNCANPQYGVINNLQQITFRNEISSFTDPMTLYMLYQISTMYKLPTLQEYFTPNSQALFIDLQFARSIEDKFKQHSQSIALNNSLSNSTMYLNQEFEQTLTHAASSLLPTAHEYCLYTWHQCLDQI